MMRDRKPRIAIHKFTSCDGCQLAFLNMGPTLLELLRKFEIAHFVEAGMYDPDAEVDVAFVEGSISIPDDIERINQVRQHSQRLVTIGACATAGGIQALRNAANADEWVAAIYPHPEFVSYLETSKPIKDYVKVDYELWGCPVSSQQILTTAHSLLQGVSPPRGGGEKVCQECKRLQYNCVMVTQSERCLGPVTNAGCGALCPSLGKACYGCYGSESLSNVKALKNYFMQNGDDSDSVDRRLHFINRFEEI